MLCIPKFAENFIEIYSGGFERVLSEPNVAQK